MPLADVRSSLPHPTRTLRQNVPLEVGQRVVTTALASFGWPCYPCLVGARSSLVSCHLQLIDGWVFVGACPSSRGFGGKPRRTKHTLGGVQPGKKTCRSNQEKKRATHVSTATFWGPTLKNAEPPVFPLQNPGLLTPMEAIHHWLRNASEARTTAPRCSATLASGAARAVCPPGCGRRQREIGRIRWPVARFVGRPATGNVGVKTVLGAHFGWDW